MGNLFDINEKEEWRPVVGFEGCYSVSSLGRVRNEARFVNRLNTQVKIPQRILKPLGSRYLSVNLWVNGVSYNKLIHRLVAEAFIPNPDNLPEVNHKDLNILNCRADNLEWVTSSKNHNHGLAHRGKGRPYRRQVKCLDTQEIFSSISAAGRSVAADATQIVESIEAQRCCKGMTFVYADELPQDEQLYLKNAKDKYQNFHFRPNMKNSRKVRVVETNQEFDSIASAARNFNCDAATISNRIQSGRAFNGVTLVFVEDIKENGSYD